MRELHKITFTLQCKSMQVLANVMLNDQNFFESLVFETSNIRGECKTALTIIMFLNNVYKPYFKTIIDKKVRLILEH